MVGGTTAKCGGEVPADCVRSSWRGSRIADPKLRRTVSGETAVPNQPTATAEVVNMKSHSLSTWRFGRFGAEIHRSKLFWSISSSPSIRFIMSLSTKPTLVFVHGAFHGPDCFDAVISILSSAGFPCVDNLKLPGTGCSTPITFEEDVAALRAILVRLIEEEGKDCVLIMHSYSGVCGPQATKGLGKRERGNKAGVSRMLFITCNIPLEGQSHLDQLLGYHKDKGLPIPGLTKVQVRVQSIYYFVLSMIHFSKSNGHRTGWQHGLLAQTSFTVIYPERRINP
jgi:hypothetical protein